MMDSYPRRVRTVRLRASNEALVRRGAILLEDALRTASLPGAGNGRLLVVRSFSVGTIRSNQSSASVALTIGRRLHQLSAQAIHAEDPAASSHQAVYFRDDAEPYVRLAVRLAQGEKTDAWFWPLTVPAWQPGMNRDEALRSLLYGVMQTQAGTAAAVRMIQELHEQEAVGGLLAALRWQDGPLLMRAFGWSRSGVPVSLMAVPSPDRGPGIPQQWASVLNRWVGWWGGDDARSAWLAGMALAADKPGRLLDPRLMVRAERLLKLTTLRMVPPHSSPRERTGREEVSTEALPDLSVPSTPADDTLSPAWEPKKGVLEEDPSPAVAGEPVQEAVRESPVQAGERGPRARAFRESPAHAVAAKPEKEVFEESPARAVPGEPENGASATDAKLEAEEWQATRESPFPLWPNAPQHTAYAGLFFLVPVLSCLGMAGFLQASPWWIENELPVRLLRYFGQRLAVPADDPVMVALGAPERREEGWLGDFIAPTIWRQGICGSGPWILRRVEHRSGMRVLFDSSGRLAVALWRGRAPDGVRDLLGALSVRRGPLMASQQPLDVVLEAWLTAMRLWCRRYARFGLRDIVCRPGRITTTRTHVDILFAHRQADARIRKAGLDLNPGWVPWLGRVVYFHYLDEEQVYGQQVGHRASGNADIHPCSPWGERHSAAGVCAHEKPV